MAPTGVGGDAYAEWVAQRGGSRVIRKILIANNGCACPAGRRRGDLPRQRGGACATPLPLASSLPPRLHPASHPSHAVGAAKCIRSMRRWAYQTFRQEGVLHFVAMATPDDVAANAECVSCCMGCGAGRLAAAARRPAVWRAAARAGFVGPADL